LDCNNVQKWREFLATPMQRAITQPITPITPARLALS
jgi:hypothetical protein